MNNTLLKSQKNDILGMIKDHAMSPASFEWVTQESQATRYDTGVPLVSKLVHTDSDYYFLFETEYGNHHAVFSPGEDKQIDVEKTVEWAEQLYYVHTWLDCLKREIEAPDLWEQITEYKSLGQPQARYSESNTPFTVTESKQIIEGLRELREQLVVNVKDDKASIAEINSRIDDVEVQMSSMGRNSWIQFLIGVLITLSLSVGIPPVEINVIFNGFLFTISEIVPMLY